MRACEKKEEELDGRSSVSSFQDLEEQGLARRGKKGSANSVRPPPPRAEGTETEMADDFGVK